MNIKNTSTFPNAGIESMSAEMIIFKPEIWFRLLKGRSIRSVRMAVKLLEPGKKEAVLYIN